jgi:hypothetical protein
MTKARSNATANAAKGDLTVGNGTNLSGVLGVGSNGDTIVADSSTSTGLSYQANFAAGKNKIINGDFGVNQRGFTSTTADNTFTFDRWRTFKGGGGSVTYSSQTFTTGSAPVAGYEGKNFIQIATTSQSGTSDYVLFINLIESVRSFAGQTVTLSFWAKANTGTPKISWEANQNFGTGGSPSSDVNTPGGAATISTSWARYSLTLAIPSISGKTLGTNNNDYLGMFFWLSAGSDLNSRSSSIGNQNNTFQIWGVQLEAGSTATAFQTATGTIQGELAACQRYYWRTTGALHTIGGGGIAGSTTECYIPVNHPVTMRVAPTSIDTANLRLQIISNSFAVTSTTISAAAPNLTMVKANTASGLTATTQSYQLYTDNSSTNHFGLSAEL